VNSETGSEDFEQIDEDDEGGSGKGRDRRKILQQADEEYRKLFPQRSQDFGRYWEDFLTSSPSEKIGSSTAESNPQPKVNSSNTTPPKATKSNVTSNTKGGNLTSAFEDVAAEFEKNIDQAKLAQHKQAQAKLQSMAAQFLKIGSRSMFGRKLGGK
jgi:hypothetical protein